MLKTAFTLVIWCRFMTECLQLVCGRRKLEKNEGNLDWSVPAIHMLSHGFSQLREFIRALPSLNVVHCIISIFVLWDALISLPWKNILRLPSAYFCRDYHQALPSHPLQISTSDYLQNILHASSAREQYTFSWVIWVYFQANLVLYWLMALIELVKW